jgi:transposase
MGPAEMSGLARRLRARAESVLLRDQPEQQNDMRAAARLIERHIQVLAEIRRLADEVKDEVEQQHLRQLLGGA